MGWLPSAPQLQTNPLQVVRDAEKAGKAPVDYVVESLKDGSLKMSAKTLTIRLTFRAICSCGAPICWDRPAKGMNIS